jgi:hypothetical protein
VTKKQTQDKALKMQVFLRLRELKLSKQDVEYAFENRFRGGAVLVSVDKPKRSYCIVAPPGAPAGEVIGTLLAWTSKI